MKTQQDLINDLDALGSTPTEVAGNLFRLDCKGRKHSSCNCPVANYLKLKGYSNPWVDDVIIYFKEEQDYESLSPPTPICTFIKDFDRNLYPDLIFQGIGYDLP
jgi:hypothetical protein